jgi:hypothetical protein
VRNSRNQYNAKRWLNSDTVAWRLTSTPADKHSTLYYASLLPVSRPDHEIFMFYSQIMRSLVRETIKLIYVPLESLGMLVTCYRYSIDLQNNKNGWR